MHFAPGCYRAVGPARLPSGFGSCYPSTSADEFSQPLRCSPMQIQPKGSPSFSLFWADLVPIAKRVGADIVKAGSAILLTALASDELRAVIAAHFGTVVGVGFASLVAWVVGGRFLRDNTRG